MKYRVGNISKFLGITTESLRHYQRLKILECRKDNGSTYKHFDSVSVSRLLAMRKMRTAGYSLADISQSMKEYSLEKYLETFRENVQNAKHQLEYQKYLTERMESHLTFVERLMEDRNQIKIEKSPAYYCFDYLTENIINIDDSYIEQFVQWTEHMLFVLNYSPCTLDSLITGSFPIKIGLAAEEKYAEFFKLHMSFPVYLRPSRLCICCLINHQINGKLTVNSAERIMDFLSDNKLTVKGEPFYVGEVSYHQNGEGCFFSKLYIPIE